MFPSPLSTRIALICLTFTLSWPSLSRADEYLGAEAILKQSQDPANIIASTQNPLRGTMAAYKPEELSPEQAANEWLNLFDQQRAQRRSFRQTNPVDTREIFWLLPPPSTWEALKTAIKNRPVGREEAAFEEICLRIMAEILTENPEGAMQEIRKGEKTLQEEIRRYGGNSPFPFMEEELIKSSNDPKLLLPFLERQIAAKGGQDGRVLVLQDMVSLVGKEKAAALIKKALTQTNQKISVSGKETIALAQEIALQNIASLKYAPWELTATIEGAPLFEALSKRFSKDPERKDVEGYYLLSLISEGKADKAETFLASLKSPSENLLPSDGIRDLERQGKTRDLFAFLDKAIAKNPNLPIWNDYINTSIRIAETDQAVKRVKQTLSDNQLTEKNRRKVEQELPQVLLTLNQVEEGITALQSTIAAPPSAEASAEREEALTARAEAARKLTELGLLLERPPLVDEGLRALQATLKAATAGGINLYESRSLPGLLYKADRGTEAEKVLSSALKNKYDTQSALLELCALYSLAGRDADVITLLQEAPGWGVEDLLPIINRSSSGFSKARTSLPSGYIAAKALEATGKPKEAAMILQQLIKKMPGFDPAYELLLKLKGPAFAEELDQMIALDRFQERPLIWKAQLLLNQGKLDEAEKTVKLAIAIDPSDGEEGPDDRMRAYAVLAKIREASGDKKEAELYQNVMKAIRLSEDADRYASAGLLTKATAMYQEALTYFSDAYCVQSRLAKNLWELGRYQEAETHYQRAYELMPDSFGRVESHCFGCESAFAGEKQQTMAEQIFRKFAQESPNKPQVHYLLGYLLQEQGKATESLASYREAVKLDPDYLNAWKKIADLETQLPPEERETAILQILRLDPLGRHGGRSDLRKIRSPKKLWETVASVTSKEEPDSETVYVLKASRENLEKQKRENPRHYPYQRRIEPFTPASAIYDRLSPIVQNIY